MSCTLSVVNCNGSNNCVCLRLMVLKYGLEIDMERSTLRFVLWWCDVFTFRLPYPRSERPVAPGGRRLRASARPRHVAGQSRAAAAESGPGAERRRADPDPARIRPHHSAVAGHDSVRGGTDASLASPAPEPLLQALPPARPVGEVQAADPHPRR